MCTQEMCVLEREERGGERGRERERGGEREIYRMSMKE